MGFRMMQSHRSKIRRLWVLPESGGPDEIVQEIAGLLPSASGDGADKPGTSEPRGEAWSPIEFCRTKIHIKITVVALKTKQDKADGIRFCSRP
jgi:hypothetical protein